MDGGIVLDAKGNVLYSSEGVLWEVAIHLAFIVSALALAWIDRMSQHGPKRAAHDEVTVAAVEAELRGEGQAGPTDADGFVTVRIPAGAPLPDGARVID